MKRLVMLCFGLIAFNCAYPQVTFVIEELPPTTPAEDTIFLTGTFNNWNTALKEYALTRQLDGRYAITVDFNEPYFEYKFTRGSFQRVETDEQNNFIGNRIYESSGKPETIPIKIVNWVDLGGVKPVNLWVFYYFSAGIIGVLISFLLLRLKKRKKVFTNIVVMLTALVTIALIGRSIYGVVNPLIQSYLVWGFHILIYLVGPTYYLFSKLDGDEIRLTRNLYHFIPASIVLIIGCLRILNADIIGLVSRLLETNYYQGDKMIVSIGLGHAAMYYLFVGIKCWPRFKNWTGEQLVKNSIWILFMVSLLIGVASTIAPVSKDLFFALLTLFIGFEGYLLLQQIEAFKKSGSNPLIIANSDEITNKLQNLMSEQKPFRNPGLNINDLAEMLEIKSHILSKVLNDDIKQNFRDFVNAYRIEEFIRLSQVDQYKNYTFLALAHEVGFNSKSTFNNAFKKVTNQTPREYFKNEGELAI